MCNQYQLPVEAIDKAQLHLDCAKQTLVTLCLALDSDGFAPAGSVMSGALYGLGEFIQGISDTLSSGNVIKGA